VRTSTQAFGIVSILGLTLLAGCAAKSATRAAATGRVGTYDSRAIAVAFAGTETFRQQLAKLQADHEQAKAAGDKNRMAELEQQGMAQQKRLHCQGFSTAPVDDIMINLKEQLSQIARTAGVAQIISKWDKAALARYPDAELVDVTMALVDALHPDARSRKWAMDMQRSKPIPLQQAEKLPVNE